MMSETAFFVKDVVGPKGSVSIVANGAGSGSESDNIEAHTKTESLRLHHGETDRQNRLTRRDERIDLRDEPDHNELCEREQRYLLKVILEDLDNSEHLDDALNSLRIVLAADQSVRTGKTIELF